MNTYTIADGDKVEKFHVALLFNNGTADSPDWIQLCKATENTITLNAETESRDFIDQKNPTELIKRYSPALSNPLTMFKGEDDYDFFWKKFYKLPTGSAANGEMLVVFMNEPDASNPNKFDAWKCNTTFVFESLDPVNSQLTFTTKINGTITEGTVTVTGGTPAFTAAS